MNIIGVAYPMSYRVIFVEAGHRWTDRDIVTATAEEAIAAAEKEVAKGFVAAFVLPPEGGEPIPLRLFKATAHGDPK